MPQLQFMLVVMAADVANGTAMASWSDVCDYETSIEVRFERLQQKREVWLGETTAGASEVGTTQMMRPDCIGTFCFTHC